MEGVIVVSLVALAVTRVFAAVSSTRGALRRRGGRRARDGRADGGGGD
jgi:hypothetical protein